MQIPIKAAIGIEADDREILDKLARAKGAATIPVTYSDGRNTVKENAPVPEVILAVSQTNDLVSAARAAQGK